MKKEKFNLDKVYVPLMPEDEGKDLDWSKARRVVFPNLKPSSKAISLRLPISMIHEAKRQANKRGMAYQSYIKYILAEGLNKNAKY